MKAPVIDPAAPAAPTMARRWRVLLAALTLTLTPGLASARATDSNEWPTAADQGPRSATRVPWMTFSGDPSTTTMLAVVPGHEVHAREVVVVRERELSRRQRRLLRRAERHAEKAARLRAKTGLLERRAGVATMVVPVAQPAAPRPVVEHEHPDVHVVHLEREHERDGCPQSARATEIQVYERGHTREAQAPVVIDVHRLSADVERQVERALRDASRAREQAERARERAERAHERARRDEQRAMQRGPYHGRP